MILPDAMASKSEEAENCCQICLDILKDLECPVCMETPESFPIYQCTQGHIVCNSCYPRVENCPVCRVKKSLTIRALTAEKALKNLLQECRHQGCSILKLDIKEHEENCGIAEANANFETFCSSNNWTQLKPAKKGCVCSKILKDLECPECLELPDLVPIYQCAQGHPVCTHCYPKLGICPECLGKPKRKIRALVVEQILRKLLQKCKNEGCSVIKNDLTEHEKICEFAIVKCSYCKDNFTRGDMNTMNHEENCQSRPKKCPHCCIQFNSFKTWYPHVLKCDYRKVKCSLCQKDLKFIDLKEHNNNGCEFKDLRILPCDHCHTLLIGPLLEEHQGQCEHRIVQCDYCNVKIEIKDLKQHKQVYHADEIGQQLMDKYGTEWIGCLACFNHIKKGEWNGHECKRLWNQVEIV